MRLLAWPLKTEVKKTQTKQTRAMMTVVVVRNITATDNIGITGNETNRECWQRKYQQQLFDSLLWKLVRTESSSLDQEKYGNCMMPLNFEYSKKLPACDACLVAEVRLGKRNSIRTETASHVVHVEHVDLHRLCSRILLCLVFALSLSLSLFPSLGLGWGVASSVSFFCGREGRIAPPPCACAHPLLH